AEGDGDAIDIAAHLVERIVGQRAPQIDSNEIPTEYLGEIGCHRLQKAGQVVRDVFGETHFLAEEYQL
ncbi:MAG: hypothetical protein WB630_07785, partial [Candidatus Acidiferrales bacterium]